MNLQSSISKDSRYVVQIIHFSSGQKKTFEWIDTHTIKDWTFTKMKLKDGRTLMVNWANVDCIESFPLPDNE